MRCYSPSRVTRQHFIRLLQQFVKNIIDPATVWTQTGLSGIRSANLQRPLRQSQPASGGFLLSARPFLMRFIHELVARIPKTISSDAWVDDTNKLIDWLEETAERTSGGVQVHCRTDGKAVWLSFMLFTAGDQFTTAHTNSLWSVFSVVFLFLNCSPTGAKQMSSYESERRPIAVYEFAGSLLIESKKLLVFTPLPFILSPKIDWRREVLLGCYLATWRDLMTSCWRDNLWDSRAVFEWAEGIVNR